MFLGAKAVIFWVTTQAQWQVIAANLPLFLVGRFPQELYWRIWLIVGAIALLSGLSWGANKGWWRGAIASLLPFLWLLSIPLTFWLMGGEFGLEPVPSSLWNGLLLTLFMAAASIILSFPLGVLLALGRQSALPVIRWLCVLYIEIIRGLPLIGILFLAQNMVPFFLPEGINLDRVLRGMTGLVIFSAAYLAENVRGGLQSVPRGQTEAAKALGLNTPLLLLLIVLPQALRAVIPAIVGQFIGLFKDTSLLSLVGLVELTGIAKSILAQPEFLGRYAEVYLFIGLLYWIFCYCMSLVARRLERA
jgi:general L-amino acid transport system permease protein